MCWAPKRCHTHSSVRLGESSWHLWIKPGWLLETLLNTYSGIRGYNSLLCYNQYRMYVISVLQNRYQAVKDGINARPADCHPVSNLSGRESVCVCVCARAFSHAHMSTCVYARKLVQVSVCVQAFVHLSCAELCSVHWENSKQSATSPKTSRALTVTQRTAQNTCWDDGDGWQPRRHMGLILALMKTTWHKYRTKRTALETHAVPPQCCWHWRKHLIILEVLRRANGEQTCGAKAELGDVIWYI